MAVREKVFVSLLATVFSSAPLFAQAANPAPVPAPAPAPVESDPDPDSEDAEDAADEDVEIVVTGQAQRGAVLGDIPPDLQLGRRDIRSYGANSVAELLQALSPQLQSGRGREGGQPVVLLNGRRISGFSEIRDLPTEAIQRVDILPEEVALQYGYRADQRVVNFVTREHFRSVTAEVEHGMATAGGRGRFEADVNILRINRNGRWSIDVEYERQDPLFESDRDIIQAAQSTPFDILGNVIAATPGAEIDPALSALAGQRVTVAALPAGAPTLAGFAAGANKPNVTDLGSYRTLLPATDQVSLNGTISRTIFKDVTASLNARFQANESRSQLGLASANLLIPDANPFSPFGSDVRLLRYFDEPGALTRSTEGWTGHAGLSLNGMVAPWRWSFTGNYDRGSSSTFTETGLDLASARARILAGDTGFNPFDIDAGTLLMLQRDRTRTETESADATAVVNGRLFDLPAGDVSTSIRAGFQTRSLDSETFRAGVEQQRELSRDQGSLQANLDLPIASRRRDVLQPLGNFSVNFNAEVEQLSDFGTLTTLGYGLNWSPVPQVSFIASATHEEGAPSMQQLGDPLQTTPNVRIFDFTRGETVDVTLLSGGNPALTADNRRVMKLGFNLQPFTETQFSLRADYVNTRIDNPIASFPTATPEIEAAFPDRFQRDAQGRLVTADVRPINFARSEREELRWGLEYSRALGPEPQGGPGGRRWGGQGGAGGQQGQAGSPGAAPSRPAGDGQRWDGRPRGGGGGGFRGGFGGGGFGGGGGGRLRFSLFHTWRLQDTVLIREGVPELDFLGGSAAGNRGGRPRHEIEGQLNLYRDGLGARLTSNWQSGTTVEGGLLPGGGTATDLRFDDFATVNLRLFADLGQIRSLAREHRWLRGMRVALSVDNLLDSRLRVTDQTGQTPIGYQPGYLDPLGRSFRVSIRKLFF